MSKPCSGAGAPRRCGVLVLRKDECFPSIPEHVWSLCKKSICVFRARRHGPGVGQRVDTDASMVKPDNHMAKRTFPAGK